MDIQLPPKRKCLDCSVEFNKEYFSSDKKIWLYDNYFLYCDACKKEIENNTCLISSKMGPWDIGRN